MRSTTPCSPRPAFARVEQRVVHEVPAVEGGAEVVHERLVLLHPCGRSPRATASAMASARPAFTARGRWANHSYFDSQKRALMMMANSLSRGGSEELEAQVLAQLLHAVGQLGAAQEHREGAPDAAAGAGRDGLRHALLGLRHPVGGEVREAGHGRHSSPGRPRSQWAPCAREWVSLNHRRGMGGAAAHRAVRSAPLCAPPSCVAGSWSSPTSPCPIRGRARCS